MKKLFAALVLAASLVATPATATTMTTTFAPFPGSPPHTITKNGITVTFGEGWNIAADNDMPNPPPPHLALTGGMFGNFANEGPQNTVLWHSSCDVSGCQAPFLYDTEVWRFSVPIRQISFQYTGSKYQHWYDEIGNHYISAGTLPLHVWLLNYDQHQIITDLSSDVDFSGRTPINYGSGYSEGTPCSGDPTGDFCNWDTFSYISSVPFSDVYVSSYGILSTDPQGPYTGIWIKSLTVNTNLPPCNNPPCEFEARAAQIRDEQPTPANRTSWGRLKLIYR